jgi:hypothetical protein
VRSSAEHPPAAVIIRLGIAAADTTAAARALRLDELPAERRDVCLLDHRGDRGSWVSRLEAAGVTLRLVDGDRDDAVLSCEARRPRGLGNGPAPALGSAIAVTEERDGERHIVCVTSHAPAGGLVSAVGSGSARLANVVPARHRAILADWSRRTLDGDRPVVMIGPIAEWSWHVDLQGTELRAVRWRLPAADGDPAFDALELSCRSTPAEADFRYPILVSSLRRRGVLAAGGTPWLESRALAHHGSVV